MRNRVWIEMPAIGTGAERDPIRSKYPVGRKALLMHQKGKVYVLLEDELSREEAIHHSDCRLLSPDEAQAFEEGLPFEIPPDLFAQNHEHRPGPLGLGDVVSRLTRKAGFTECGACQQRKRSLNKIVVWGWWRSH